MNDLLTVEDTLLEEMFEHEAGCESRHALPNSRACLVKVTHRYHSECGSISVMICDTSAAATQENLDTRDRQLCNGCGPMPTSHWQVLPA